MAQGYLARTLWLLGFPDQAIRFAENSIKDARTVNQTQSLCYALALAACPIALLVGDLVAAEHYVGMLIEHSTRHALAHWRAYGRCYQGALIIERGDLGSGVGLVRAAFDELGGAKSAVLRLIELPTAEALGRAGKIKDGLTAIEEAIEHSERAEERWLTAELLRVKGQLLLLQGGTGYAEAAEDHFRQALDWARRQGALSWELRAATSLARMLRDQGRYTDATALLQPVYGRFTEGFQTADLAEARALIDALPSSKAR
jgi:predicted ATPase